jgi:adenylate cyclase
MNNEYKKNIQYYIPERIMKILAENKSRIHRNEKLRGGVLFFDLVKFTRLTVLFTESGPRGAEKLHELMTKYYDLMIDIIHKYGGAIYQFAGDSAIAVFEENESGELETMFTICACALEMKNVLERSDLQYKEHKFIAKFALSYGDFQQVLLGNDTTYFQIALLGPAIERVVQAEVLARQGEIILAPEIALAVKEFSEIGWEQNTPRLEKLNRTVKTNPIKPFLPDENDDKFLKKCSRFLPPVLAKKIKESKMDYLGEFRDVSCVFIQVDGIDFSRDSNAIEFLNKIYVYICELCAIYSGILIQSDFTDKGSVFLILFGAPVALEKKEMMAVRFSLKLLENRKQFSFIKNLNIGIAGGPMYCGDVGSTKCKGYSVMGEFINLASRLMQYPTGDFPALDQRTAKSLPETFIIEETAGVRLKGIAESVSVFKITGEKKAHKIKVDQSPLVGRKKEVAWLKDRLNESVTTGTAVGMIGDAGVGKSRLVFDFLENAQTAKFEIYSGICYSYEKFTPYFPWKAVLLKIFNLHDEIEPVAALFKIEAVLKSLENFENNASVFETWARVFYRLIGGSTEETSYTSNMDPKKKSEQIFQITGLIFAQKTARGKILVLFEDYHWIDESSENLIHNIHALDIPGLMFVFASRPEGPVYKWGTLKRYQQFILNEFSVEDSVEYIRTKMNLAESDPKTLSLEKEILHKGRGNPFFLESIIYSLREQQVLIEDQNGKCRLSGEDREIEIPNSIQGVLLSRIDRLDETAQQVLKNASVIGRLFSFTLLKSIASKEIEAILFSHLSQLESNDFTIMESSDPLTYLFKHVLIRDVAYNSLLSVTRESLHNRLAIYLESLGEENIQENIDLLAYHFFQARNLEKAIEYSLSAARSAAANYSNSDAIHHYTNVLQMIEETSGHGNFLYDIKIELGHVYRQSGYFAEAIDIFQEPLTMVKDRKKLARIHTGLGQVYHEQGDVDLAILELEMALKFVGGRLPQNKISTSLGLLIQLTKRMIYRMIPFLPFKAGAEKTKNLEMRFDIIMNLAKIFFFIDSKKFGLVNLIQANISDRINNKSKKSRSYASLSLIYGALGLYSWADKTVIKSKKYIKDLNEPLIEAWFLSRTAPIEMYRNDPSLLYEKLKEALTYYERYGETWEKLLTIATMNISLMYMGKFKEAKISNDLLYKISLSENVKQFQGWALSAIGIFEYLLNVRSFEECLEMIHKASDTSLAANNMATFMATIRYILILFVRENKIDEALKQAKKLFDSLNGYTSIIPHAHAGYFEVIAALELVVDKNLISKKESDKIWNASLKKLKALGKKYYFITGYSLRAEAKTFALKGNTQAARKKITEAVDWYEKSQNEWERTLTYYDAARLIPERQNEYIEKGIALCQRNEYAGDLIRFQKLYTSLAM